MISEAVHCFSIVSKIIFACAVAYAYLVIGFCL